MADSMDEDEEQRPDLPRFRDRLALIAAVVTGLSLLGLAVVARYQPNSDPNAKGFELGLTTYSTLTALLTVVLGVGIISLFFELLLRESYARDVRRLLGLNTQIVKSGLLVICREPLRSAKTLRAGSKITAVIRDPQLWVVAQLGDVIAAAQARSVTVHLMFPDVESDHFDSVAMSLDLPAQQLRENINAALDLVKSRWQTPGIHAGSKIVISAVELPLYDLVVVDDFAMISLGRTFDQPRGEERLSVSFRTTEYPLIWFKEQLDVTEDPLPELWAADADASAHSRLRARRRTGASVAVPSGAPAALDDKVADTPSTPPTAPASVVLGNPQPGQEREVDDVEPEQRSE